MSKMASLLLMSVLLVLLKPSFQASSMNSKTYIGAVVEYHPTVDGKNGQIVAEANADRYQKIIETASAHNVDIIVFPESGITSLPKYGPREDQLNATEFRAFYRDTASFVPSPDESIVPCDRVDGKYKQSLRKISCAARENKMYVVVNHHERVDCPEPNCSPDNFLLYNTNVAFDRDGKVVARYRKYNLYAEDGTNVTAQPEFSTFTTDFGVTFGQLICADIYREIPAKFFVKNPNVTDVIFSTHWFNELPFSDAVQHQAGWSYGANVNFLASNYNRVRTSSGGSGIYAGTRGPIVSYHSLKASTALIVALIPKFKNGKPAVDIQVAKPTVIELTETPVMEELPVERNYLEDLQKYTTENLDLKKSSINSIVCDRGLCCNFEVKIERDKGVDNFDVDPYRYRFVVFNGVAGAEAKDASTAGLETCALVACVGDRIEDCGNVHPPGTKVAYPFRFLSVTIRRQLNFSEHAFYEPSTLTLTSRLPLDGKDFSLVGNERGSSELSMSLVKAQKDLLVFGIWGRRFDRDGQKPSKFVLDKP